MQRPTEHPAIPAPRIGVLVVNLGTPDAPDARAVRRYLAEFLSDRRVVEIPAWAWQPILHGIILRTRPKKSAHAYAQVWSDEGSPLAAITARQAKALRAIFADPVSASIAWASIENLLIAVGCRIIEGDGSRVRFVKGDLVASFHRPHPAKEVRRYQVRDAREFLMKLGVKP